MNGEQLMAWLARAATYSETTNGVTRCFLTPQHQQLLNWLRDLASKHGLEFQIDDSGNGRIRKTAKGAKHSSTRTLLFGSHQDTVRAGGQYDGILGILLPLAVIIDLPPLPFDVEVLAFGDEEGTRFNSTLIGSSALAGTFDYSMLLRHDDCGITMEDAMRQFGLCPENIDTLKLDSNSLLGFIEVHIEQGPILEDKALPVGLVSAITGIERHLVMVSGKAGHAGTTPMTMRQDALVKAADIIKFVNQLCCETEQLVGVVGKLHVEPNSVNVIPARVELTVELRSPDSTVRHTARRQLQSFLDNLHRVEHQCIYTQEGIQCDGKLTQELGKAIKSQGIEPITIFSGAGHDGLAMSKVAPTAMFFIRCKEGLSHHPDESITAQDCGVGMAVIRQFILNQAQLHD